MASNTTDMFVNGTRNVTYFAYTPPDALKYGTVFVTSIGLFGNGFAVISIVYRRLYKSTMFIFFLFMSSMDLVVVLTNMLLLTLLSFGIIRLKYPEEAAGLHGRLYIGATLVAAMAMLSSVWSLIASNCYKLYALIKPFRVKPTDTKYAYASCLTILVVFTSYQSVAFMGFEMVNVGNDTVYTAGLGINEDYSWYMIYVILPSAFFSYTILPAVLLPILACCMIVKFYFVYKQHQMLTGDAKRENSVYKTARKGIYALLALSFVHMSLTVPSLFIVLFSFQGDRVDLLSGSSLANTLVLSVNHSINFYAQFVCSRYYRDSILGR